MTLFIKMTSFLKKIEIMLRTLRVRTGYYYAYFSSDLVIQMTSFANISIFLFTLVVRRL